MDNQKLKPFKIGDRANQKPNRIEKGAQTPASPSAGFARLERLLDDQDAADVSANLAGLLTKLESYGASERTPRTQMASQKAIAAIEKGADLIEHLYETKAAMAPEEG